VSGEVNADAIADATTDLGEGPVAVANLARPGS
jgi:hypothetical protein